MKNFRQKRNLAKQTTKVFIPPEDRECPHAKGIPPLLCTCTPFCACRMDDASLGCPLSGPLKTTAPKKEEERRLNLLGVGATIPELSLAAVGLGLIAAVSDIVKEMRRANDLKALEVMCQTCQGKGTITMTVSLLYPREETCPTCKGSKLRGAK